MNSDPVSTSTNKNPIQFSQSEQIIGKYTTQQIKDIIINSPEPLLLKNTVKWNILRWSLQDWKKSLENEEMEFRIGNFGFSREPQWEKQTNIIKGKFDFFLAQSESDTKQWLYFDYKHLKNVLVNASDLQNVHRI